MTAAEEPPTAALRKVGVVEVPRRPGAPTGAAVLLALVVVALGAAFAWWRAAAPYRLFPCDDLHYVDPDQWLDFQPVFALSVQISLIAARVVGLDALSAILLNMVVASAITTFLIALTIWRATRNAAAAVMAALVFATSPWLATYFCMASYVPLATMFSTLSLLLLLEGHRVKATSEAPRGPGGGAAALHGVVPLVVGSGTAASLAALCAASAPLVLALEAAAIVLVLFPGATRGDRLRLLGFFLLPLALMAPHLVPMAAHWRLNAIDNQHMAAAARRFGSAPPRPFFTFFRILSNRSPFLLVGFLGTMVGLVSRLRRRDTLPGRYRSVLFLVLLVCAHATLVDLLPFTPLGRVHYLVYPALIVAIFGAASVSRRPLVDAPRTRRWPERWLLAAGLAVLLGMNVVGFRETIAVKQAGAQYLEKVARDGDLYVLAEDPHAYFISKWLGRATRSVNDLSETAGSSGRRVAVIMGPQGDGSGRSILAAADLDDFRMRLRRPEGAEEVLLPYYAYYPAFVFEEEVAEALFFARQMPEHRSADHLTVWIWRR